jgi:hypothetical protein
MHNKQGVHTYLYEKCFFLPQMIDALFLVLHLRSTNFLYLDKDTKVTECVVYYLISSANHCFLVTCILLLKTIV